MKLVLMCQFIRIQPAMDIKVGDVTAKNVKSILPANAELLEVAFALHEVQSGVVTGFAQST